MSFLIAAAERLHQGHVEGEAARLQVGQAAQAVEQQVFGGKHLDVSGKSAFVTIAGNAMRFAGRRHRTLGFVQASAERFLAQRGVSHFLQRLGERAVVVGHRFIVGGRRAAQFAAQASAGEDR